MCVYVKGSLPIVQSHHIYIVVLRLQKVCQNSTHNDHATMFYSIKMEAAGSSDIVLHVFHLHVCFAWYSLDWRA